IGRPHSTAVPVPSEGWMLVATVPAIVSEEQLQMVQQKLSHNQSFANRNNKANTYLLRALVSCGKCKRACVAVTRERKYKYYICSGKDRGHHPEIEELCSSRFIPVEQLDELVWADLCEVLMHPESIRQALERAHGGHWLPQELQARRENLRKGRTGLANQLERLTDAYLGGIIPLAEYERRRRDLEQRDRALDAQEGQLEAQSDKHVELVGLMAPIEDFCRRVESGLASADFEQKRKLVELLIDRVIVTDGDVEIRYVLPTSPGSEHVRFCHLRTDYFLFSYTARVEAELACPVRS
ncbi:MAG: zinc ribbon domain-containing protein, partial [Chloroflexota bacterium]|nr:zinc ribbon domain-containing protein [Chloroflexota bacterium]